MSRDLEMADVLVALWRGRKLILSITISFLIVGILYSLLAVPYYTATATILPRSDEAPTALLSQIAQFTGNPTIASTNYEQLYNEIVKSDQIVDRVLSQKWKYLARQDSVYAFQIFGTGDKDASINDATVRARSRRFLRENVIIFDRDVFTGFMKLEVTVPRDPQLAADMANFIIHDLEIFIADWRNRKAREQRTFVGERLEKVSEDLDSAQARLTEFLENNRSYADSPVLREQYNRLDREVQAQESIWVELRRQLELAKIEENRDQATIDILDRAIPPVRASRPKRGVIIVLLTIAGMLIALVAMAIRHEFRVLRARRLAT